MISVIIQSRGNDFTNIKRSIGCFQQQKYTHKELILIIDQIFTPKSYQDRLQEVFGNSKIVYENIHIFSNINADFAHNNVSAMRNFGIQKAKGDFILMMDDDEDIPDDYLDLMMSYWKKYRSKIGKDFVLTPTLMYRHTGKIQNQGFSHFNYRLSRPTVCELGQSEWARIQMYSGNSLFAPASIFHQVNMDERFDFVYEDLAYTQALNNAGFPIIVTKNIEIFHMERDKTKLEDAWIGNVFQAYRKAKHRILFVRKFANFWQKCQFFVLGFRGQPLWLIAKVFLFNAPKKREIISAILKGTRDGMK